MSGAPAGCVQVGGGGKDAGRPRPASRRPGGGGDALTAPAQPRLPAHPQPGEPQQDPPRQRPQLPSQGMGQGSAPRPQGTPWGCTASPAPTATPQELLCHSPPASSPLRRHTAPCAPTHRRVPAVSQLPSQGCPTLRTAQAARPQAEISADTPCRRAPAPPWPAAIDVLGTAVGEAIDGMWLSCAPCTNRPHGSPGRAGSSPKARCPARQPYKDGALCIQPPVCGSGSAHSHPAALGTEPRTPRPAPRHPWALPPHWWPPASSVTAPSCGHKAGGAQGTPL